MNLKTRQTRKFKQKNCAPRVRNKTIHAKSCYTSSIIENLKKLYNKRYHDKIVATKPRQIWKELKSRFSKCNSEDCWLKELSNPNVAQKIEKAIFSPKKPASWKKNPNEWLTNYDIRHVLEQYEDYMDHFEFIGPSFIDFNETEHGTCIDEEVCNFDLSEKMKDKKSKIGIIFNLDKHNMSGSHWVSLFIDLDEGFVFYFDSAGDPIPKEIKALVEKNPRSSEKIKYKNGLP